MHEHTLNACVAIIVAGGACQWLAWRLKVPVILLLLVVGFAAGPVLGWLTPDALFGPILMPTISLAAAVVLFEGGLGMPWRRVRTLGHSVYGLVTVGAAVTGIGLAWAAHAFLGMGWGGAAMLGAILVVTGPTVIGPLMRHVRPRVEVGRILEYEGVLIDPIGAIAAVLVYEVVAYPGSPEDVAFAGLGRALLAGVISGGAGALVIEALQRTSQLPEFLRGGVSLSIAMGVYAGASWFQGEAGLLAVTVMGIVLASRSRVRIESLLALNQHLVVLLVSFLFIVLAARIELEALLAIPTESWAFLACVFLMRPIAVALSTFRSPHGWRERLFLSCIAPRGIVAAAMASVFGAELVARGVDGAEQIMPMTFATVVVTVAVYGLAARPLARVLGLARPRPTAVLIHGAGVFARELASAIRSTETPVTLVDEDVSHCMQASALDLEVVEGSLLDRDVRERIDFDRFSTLIVAGDDPARNMLVATRLRDSFRRVLYVPGSDTDPESSLGEPLGGNLGRRALDSAVEGGAQIRADIDGGQYLFTLDGAKGAEVLRLSQ